MALAKLLKVLPYWLATGRHLERLGRFLGVGKNAQVAGSTRKANKCTKEVCETHGVFFAVFLLCMFVQVVTDHAISLVIMMNDE